MRRNKDRSRPIDRAPAEAWRCLSGTSVAVCSTTRANPSSDSLPRPTSTSVPTTARTILRRNRSAVISKAHPPGMPSTECPAGVTHTAYRSAGIRMKLGERSEIADLGQHGGRRVHGLEVKTRPRTAMRASGKMDSCVRGHNNDMCATWRRSGHGRRDAQASANVSRYRDRTER